ncbi:MAG: carboxypeptidase regulatory-like domain-containing protein [Thermoplasmata archaeon]
MDPRTTSWWRRHGWTVAILLTAFGITILIRTVFTVPIIQQFGSLYIYGGGSDSYYHSRVTTYIIQNHANLIHDSLLKYPLGAINPREPLFDWMNAILGMLFAGAFGGNAVNAGAFFLEIDGPVWAGLSIFPIYLIGKELRNRRVGLIAAMIFPFLVANIDSSTLGYANYLSFYTFFILLVVYGYIRTVKSVGSYRWVESYRHPRQIPSALRAFLRYERTAVKWAVFTGVSFGALALAWQGYSFAVAVIVIFVIFALIVERIRRVDSFGLYVSTWIVGLVGFPLAMPYYVAQGLFGGWFDIPLLVFFGALLVALPFMALRDTPWVISIPVLIGVAALAIIGLALVNNSFFVTIVTGQGYFVKTLVYSTVAEAQAPSIDSLILGYGVVTFFIAFVGLALIVVAMARLRYPRALMFFLSFAVVSIYLPISAAKFFYVASPVFALLPAEAIARALDVGNYAALRRNVASLADRRGKFTAFRRSFKVRHVLVMLLVVGILVPNVWYAIDAGIPENTKAQFNQQVYNTLPPVLRPPANNSTNFFLGAAGTLLDTPNQYDEAGYNWLAGQDVNLPAPAKPALISWWDYGFQTIDEGLHPAVADNFQNGIEPSGNFLLAQNESLAIGVLAATLLSAETQASGQPYLPPALNQILTHDGVDVTELHTLLINTTLDIALVIANPDKYLPVDASELSGVNAMYDTVSYFLASTLTENGVVQVYNDIQAFTHWTIKYVLVDSRLFPFSGSNTGIFYAPADLTDRVIGAGGAPIAYYNLTATGSDGNTYPIADVPPGISIVNVNINYMPAFYNSIIYRTFIGYNATEAGISTTPSQQIPGLQINEPIMPGWMMEHFEAVYRTAFYCPYANVSAHPNCFNPINLQYGEQLSKSQNGTLDASAQSYFSGGETILEYYPGQTLVGNVQLPNGSPVPGVRLTVYDQLGIPHMTTTTSASGAYSLILPPGNDTVNVTSGSINGLLQAGSTVLDSMPISVSNAAGLGFSSPAVVRPIMLQSGKAQGFVYWNAANNTTYQPTTDPLVSGAKVTLTQTNITVQATTTDASGAFSFQNLPPGTYNYTITYENTNFTQSQINVTAGQTTNLSTPLQPGRVAGLLRTDSGALVPGAAVTIQGTKGFTFSTASGADGAYIAQDLPTGNYTISARSTAFGVASQPQSFAISTTGQLLDLNLTLVDSSSVTMIVRADGAPATGIPVRFTPIASGSTSAAAANLTAGSFTLISGPGGVLTTDLAVGNYSLYGLGVYANTFYAGFSTIRVPSSPFTVQLPPLDLSVALALRGTLVLPAGSNASLTSASVTAYDPAGDRVSSFANASGGYVLRLPAGSYSLLGSIPGTNGTQGAYAGLTTATLSASTTVNLPLSAAIELSSTVGNQTPAGTIVPVPTATVSVSVPDLGVVLVAGTNSSGKVSFLLPGTLPSPSTYCVGSSAPGYTSVNICGYAPSSLATLTHLLMPIDRVPVTVTVVGLPSSTSLTLNLTARSSTAINTTAVGSSPFTFQATPGTYELTGFAPLTGFRGLYMPPVGFTITVVPGAGPQSYTLTILRQVSSVGQISAPSPVTAANVTLIFSNQVTNFTLNGATFEHQFYAPAGSYSVYSSATVNNRTYAGLQNVTINATNGAISQTISLSSSITETTFELEQPGAIGVNATLPVTILGPGGTRINTTASVGNASVTLPSNGTYSIALNATALLSVNGLGEYRVLSVPAGYTCAVSGTNKTCVVPLNAVTLRTPVTGSVTLGGAATSFGGTLQLLGPNGTIATIPITNGAFRSSVLPGTYTALVTAGTYGLNYANLTTLTVQAISGPPLSIPLAPTWTDIVTVRPPAQGLTGPVTLSFISSSGTRLNYTNEPINQAVPVILPTGVYSIRATASTTPYGVQTTAVANATVSLINGNSATNLVLVPTFVSSASVRVVAPTSVLLGTGGSATFGYVVRNTGNVPEALTMKGSPATLVFSFDPLSFTLGVGASVGGYVTIFVPYGTAVAHPAIVLEAMLTNGTVAGTTGTSNGPTVSLTPFPALKVGTSGVAPTITATSVSVPFFVANPGNAQETVNVTIADKARLNSFGWSVELLSGTTASNGNLNLSASSNQTLSVLLTATTPNPLPPQYVQISAKTVGISPSAQAQATVAISTLTLEVTAPSLTVTGPSIGTPQAYPDWLVPVLSFVPAIVLVGTLLVYRWYRTRRWVRR